MRKQRVALIGEWAMNLYAERKTDAEIAGVLGVEVSTVGAWRRRMGLQPNKKPRDRELTPLERDAIEARKHGMTYGQYKASQTLGTSYGQYRLGHKFGGKKHG